MVYLAVALLLSVADKPPAMAGHSLVYAPKLGGVLLVNGDATETSTVWKWDGKTWSEATRSSSPTRSLAAAAYDSDSGTLIVHGGATGTKNSSGGMDWKVSAETLSFDGKAWKTLSTTGPIARDHHAMAYDSHRKKLVLFGGGDADPSGRSVFYGDTWEWDGKSWTKVADSGPNARVHHSMAYDEARQKVVLVGGYGPNSTMDGKTWEWDGKTWTPTSTGGPAYRSSPRLAFHKKLGKVVLFGGDSSQGMPSNTLAWDGKAWSVLASDGPSGRSVHALAYDDSRDTLVLFGGATPDPANDLWEFSGGKWTKKQ